MSVADAATGDFPGRLPAQGPLAVPVPPALRGVWQRTLLAVPGQADDTRSTVFWLQTAHWHGDLRLPADRPGFQRAAATSALSPQQAAWLATQQGFAGFTEVRPQPDHDAPLGVPAALQAAAAQAPWCEWHRRFDVQPFSGKRDLGVLLLSEDGDTLEEYGVEADYHETWRRLPGSAHRHGAWWRLCSQSKAAQPPVPGWGATWQELLLVAGHWFFRLQRDPASVTPPDAGCPVPDRAGVTAPAGALILSFGTWAEADGRGRIRHSTAPWLEGETVRRDASWELWQP